MAGQKQPRKWVKPSGATAPGSGGPVYDATLDMHTVGDFSTNAGRLAAQRDLYHYGDPVQAARSLSNFEGPYPNPTAIAMMGLAAERDAIERAGSGKWEAPFPGVDLGSGPSFNRSPDTVPLLSGVQHLSFGAHQVESQRASRARFGR